MPESAGATPLLYIAGSICLLLWGSQMVRTSVEKAFAPRIGALVSGASSSQLRAVFSGAVAALVLQSATAAILLTASFVTGGLLPLGFAIAAVLGADLGSALAARVLYLDVSFLSPLLICLGFGFYRLSAIWRHRQFGRILFGLGLILLSIQLIRQAVAPMADAPLSTELIALLEGTPVLVLLLVALFTWLAHSSVAVVLIVASMADAGIVSAPLAVFAVVGANLGSGLIAWFLVDNRDIEAYALVLSNLLMRAALGLLVVLASGSVVGHLHWLGGTEGVAAINLHLCFNAVLAVLFAPLSGRLVEAVRGWAQDRSDAEGGVDSIAPGSGLDPSLVSRPQQALSRAQREALRLADNTEALFSEAMNMFEARDKSHIDRLVEADREINERNKAIQHYLSGVRRNVTDDAEEAGLDEILRFATTMENIGDVVSHDLARQATKRFTRGVVFSGAGQEELLALHEEVLKLLQMDISNFAGGDSFGKKSLDKQIRATRELASESNSRHRLRLSKRKQSSIGTSSIHQDTVRDLMQVVSYIENRDIS